LRQVKIRNQGKAKAVLGTVSIRTDTVGAGDAFAITKNPCTAPIAPKGSCTLNLSFAPTTVGTINGTLTVPYNGGSLQIGLSGGGLAAAVSAPQTVNFGTATHGQSGRTQKITITNNNPIGLQLSAANTPGPDFAIVSDGCSSQVLPAKSKCVVSVAFSPQVNSSGTIAGALAYHMNYGSNSGSVSIGLNGQAR